MGVVIPGYHLQSGKDLPHLRKRLKGGRTDRMAQAEINLTSLIDMFSVVILFLISHFSATGEILFVNKDIKLPEAYHARELERAPIVTIFKDRIMLETTTVGDNRPLNADANGRAQEEFEWDLPKLEARLKEYKDFFEGIHEGSKFPNQVIIQADKKLDFLYLKRVMFTLTKIGFTDINLAVRGEAVKAQPKPNEAAAPPAQGG